MIHPVINKDRPLIYSMLKAISPPLSLPLHEENLALLTGLLVTEFILAIICGPYSCAWGNETYFYSGIIILLVCFILPLLHKAWPAGKRMGFGFLFLLAALAVWVLGFIVGDFRIMCRMF